MLYFCFDFLFQGLTKKQKDLQEAVWEVLKTEVDYIRRLKVIIDVSVYYFLVC